MVTEKGAAMAMAMCPPMWPVLAVYGPAKFAANYARLRNTDAYEDYRRR
jgi:hypothetical protein